MNDPVAAGDFGRLMQYGAVGVIACGLLTIVVMIFRQLITHALDQNKQLMEQQREDQAKTIEALHAIGQSLRDVHNTLVHFKVDVSRDVAEMANEMTSPGSRAHRIRPPRKDE
jgi:Zn-dependent oligopeptidase